MGTSALAVAPGLYAEPRFVTDPSECAFYTTTELPGRGVIDGYWDLRGHEREYLGGFQFAGKRVLEIGPASGALTFFMERDGAEVVSVEAAPDYRMDYCWDIPAVTPPNADAYVRDSQAGLRLLHNSYWLAHRALGSHARVHYGSAYAIPAALGEFDVSTVASVLLHNKNPFAILEGVARVTREAVVLVEIMPVSEDAVTLIRPGAAGFYDGWFHLHPRFAAQVMQSMGFGSTTVTRHRQKAGARAPAGYGEFYTLVARR